MNGVGLIADNVVLRSFGSRLCFRNVLLSRRRVTPMKSPLLVLAGFFALGIFLARPEHLLISESIRDIALLLAWGGISVICGLIFLKAGWQRASFLLALAGFGIAGATTAFLFEFRFPPNHVRYLASSGIDVAAPVRLEGALASTPIRTRYGLEFDVEASGIEVESSTSRAQFHPLTGKIRLRLETSDDPEAWSVIELMHLQLGDSIRALVRLHRPRIYQNPGSFNFRHWMESMDDLYWEGTIKSPLLVDKLPGARGLGVRGFLEKTRGRLVSAIDALYPPWSNKMRDGAVLKAVLLGERNSLDSDTIENFRKTGLYHLLVIAGLHIGLLALIVEFLLRVFPIGQSWRSGLVLAFLVIYALLVEQRAPTLRAALMISIYLIARLLYREHASLNAIGFAALVLLLYRPAWLLESGFELSFAAALLIAGLAVPILVRTTEPYRRALRRIGEIGRDISFNPHQAQFRLDVRALTSVLKSRVAFMRGRPRLASFTVTGPIWLAIWMANALLFSAILQVGLLLPMAKIFHRVAIAGIGLNALAIPVMIALLGIALPTVCVAAISPAIAAWPAKVVSLILSALFALTDLPGLPGWLSFRVSEPPAWVAWGFVLATVIAALALGRRARVFWVSMAALSVLAALIALHPFPPRLPLGVFELTALDCGAGEALFLVLPDQTTLLMDAGGTRRGNTREMAFQGRRWDPGENIVSPYLWSRGIEKIDVLALSDAREEHLGGLAAVVRNFHVGEFWHGGNPFTPSYQDLLEQVNRRGITIRELGAGDRFVRGTTTFLTLWPPVGPATHFSSQGPTRDDSLVMRISNGEASALLPGEISGNVEQELLGSGFPLEARALQVAHAGSKNTFSSEFLGRVLPQVALVSAEDGGRSGQQRSDALERLRMAGAQVYRTDFDGAVTVKMQAGSISVHTYRASPTD